jgi:hypothetical protein
VAKAGFLKIILRQQDQVFWASGQGYPAVYLKFLLFPISDLSWEDGKTGYFEWTRSRARGRLVLSKRIRTGWTAACASKASGARGEGRVQGSRIDSDIVDERKVRIVVSIEELEWRNQEEPGVDSLRHNDECGGPQEKDRRR